MRTDALFSVLVATAVISGCGGAVTPPPARSAHAAIQTSPAPARPARWVFLKHPGFDLTSKLDLGDGRVLFAGKSGRRALTRGEDIEDAPYLALADFAAIMRDGRGFAFIASDGSVYRASEPLGLLGAPQPGPLAAEPAGKRSVLSIAAGHSAVVAVLSDGTVMRSTDLGHTWTRVDYAASNKPFGRAVSVALDREGNGVLVHLPQRLFVTHDDGATWAPIASPANVGATRALRGDDGRVHVIGYHDLAAVLDGQALRPAPADNGPAFPTTRHPQPYTPPKGVTLLAGDHIFHVEHRGEPDAHGILGVAFASAKHGEQLGAPRLAPKLGGWMLPNGNLRFAAHGSSVLFLRNDGGGTSSVLTSEDFGVTWAESAKLSGLVAAEDPGVVELGPRGWALLPSLCRNPFDTSSDCTGVLVRAAGASAFKPLVSPEPFQVAAAAFDEARNRVFLLGTSDGHQRVYAAALTGGSFARTDLLDVPADAETRITVDPSGTLRVMTYDHVSRAWVLRRAGADGKAKPLLYVALEGQLALAGLHGLLMSQERAYETADGGETWMRVPTNTLSMGAPQCSEAGCMTEDTQRIGWDLPAVQSGPKVLAELTAPRPDVTWARPSARTQQAPQRVGISCTSSGSASTVKESPSVIDARGGKIRWASFEKGKDGRVSVVVADRGRVRRLPLLGPEGRSQRGVMIRTDVTQPRDGVVAVREVSRAPRSGAPRSADFELAWWSPSTGRAAHHRIVNVTLDGDTGASGSRRTWIVSGGLLFKPATTWEGKVYFVHDDGKVELLAVPLSGAHGIAVDEIVRNGHDWLTTDNGGNSVHFAWSNDDGKTWQQGAWGLGRQGGGSLETVGGRLAFVYADSETKEKLLFPMDAHPPNEPPTPTVLPEGEPDNAACEVVDRRAPVAGERLSVAGSGGRPAVELDPGGEMRLAAGSGQCVAAYAFHHMDRAGERKVVVQPLGTGWAGWQITQTWRPNGGGYFTRGNCSVEPLTCTPTN